MDSPKKVTAVWESTTSSLLLLGIAAVIAIGVAGAGVLVYRRKRKH